MTPHAQHVNVRITERLRAAGCVFAQDEAQMLAEAASTSEELDRLVTRREAGEPLEHVLGWAEFCGLRIHVTAGVFVPRYRTELLAEQAIAIASTLTHPVVLDMCCGAAPVAAAVADQLDRVELHAAELDPAAVRCARRNLGTAGTVHAGDLFDPLPAGLRGRVDVLVANAPYVPTPAIATMPREAREHEPVIALDGGSDGLDVQRRIIEAAPSWLAAGGHLLIETSRPQAPSTLERFRLAGLDARIVRSDEPEATIVAGRLGAG